MNTQEKKQSGFTIIEVVLVLAIAGLIFLMIFIALPALQRGQRDSQRKLDLARAQTAVSSYKTNNKSKLPADWNTQLRDKYLINVVGGDTFEDPTRGMYEFAVVDFSAAQDPGYEEDKAKIQVVLNATCSGEEVVASGSGGRKAAMRLKLEGGGIACVSS